MSYTVHVLTIILFKNSDIDKQSSQVVVAQMELENQIQDNIIKHISQIS